MAIPSTTALRSLSCADGLVAGFEGGGFLPRPPATQLILSPPTWSVAADPGAHVAAVALVVTPDVVCRVNGESIQSLTLALAESVPL